MKNPDDIERLAGGMIDELKTHGGYLRLRDSIDEKILASIIAAYLRGRVRVVKKKARNKR